MKLALLALLGGCLRTTTFRCTSDAECGIGTCESVGVCSFADATCTSGRRFGEHSGEYAGECVDETGDAGVDAASDVAAGCSADHVPLTGGQAGHRYKVHPGTARWGVQRTACASEGGYLGIPNDAGELQAMLTAAGAAIAVGISDAASENTWLDVLGTPATFLPWASVQPDNANPGEHCVRAEGTTFTDERCARAAPAVCECVE